LPRSVQRVWVSPTGRTAYGVIHIRLPLPVGADLVLWRFISEMRKREGQGTLLSRQPDPGGRGLRFTAEDPRYRLHARLLTSGRHAWVVYAGVLRAEPAAGDEISLAEQAREQTQVGAGLSIH
jgi:hypothetical protein